MSMRTWKCATIFTGTCFPIPSTSLSPFLFLVQSNHLWIWREHKQKSLRRKVIPQLCCTHPLQQVTGHTPKRENIGSFRQQLKSYLFSTPWSPTSFLTSSPCLFSRWESILHPSPHSSLPLPTLHHLRQVQWTCGCLHVAKLSDASGH